MITMSDYASRLRSNGRNLSEVRKNQADQIMNITFTGDIGYKKVFILDPDEGWHYTDAKYIKHSNVSMAKDQVDHYLQFRPKEHHPVGTYVFIPDDTSFDLENLNEEDPLNGDVSNLWMIVGRTDDNQFVRYMVLKINWKFRWVFGHGDRKKVYSCWGCHRSANSYTSGWWNDFFTTGLDSLTAFWLPDTYYIFGDDGLQKYGLDDTRLITHQQRTMITHNKIHPACYIVSKIRDIEPSGIIKLSLKLDELDPSRDNVDLLLCDYYNDTGDIVVDKPTVDPDPEKTSTISYMVVNADGELEESSEFPATLDIGKTYYYRSSFSNDNVDGQWRVLLVGNYTEEERIAIERLMVLRVIDSNTVSLRPAKSKKLPGLQFKLNVCDINGDYSSSVDVEVTA